ncbi:MAG: (deoxy)nucleoside triphosphate pyrophosphohydrolase [Oligoflexia bacterium]|nr:(deoxy)nucleoside triphosphate pyrophosphohydrolase [Oligoflexia bacterium]
MTLPGTAPIRVVAAVLVRQGRVLAARRPLHKSQGGLWELPGGKVEDAETDATALARELREELAIDVSVHERLAQNVHAYDHQTVRLVALRCELLDGQPRALEHLALRWLGADELDSVTWAPADLPLLPAVLRCLE